MNKNKIVSATEAIALIQSGDTLCTSGFVGTGTPEELICALETRFLETGEPRDLSLIFAAAPGDGKTRGVNRLHHEGLLKRVIGGHWSLVPKISQLAVDDKIEAYNLPMGTMTQLFRDIAAHRAGLLTKVGLGTFVDPRQQGGRLNAVTDEELVKLLSIDGEEWLFYKAFPIQVAFLRGTTADSVGNITMEKEALNLDNLAIAMAVKNSNGLVIAQVERVASCESLNPRQVIIPRVLVDCVVVAEPENHSQTYATHYSPAFSGEIRVELGAMEPMELDERKIIARRCAFELPMNGIVNLGIGMPEGVAAVANEEQVLDYITLTAEAGVIGGMPQGGLDFGAAINTDAVIHQNQQFDFYDGGGLDLAALGLAQADRHGNVNVSKFGTKIAGAGGFINISQNARKLIFAGTFTASGLKVEVKDNRLHILQEGKVRKFLEQVEQITFNGSYAAENQKLVYYVTERCVFRLTQEGLELIEVAPGIDIEKDIVGQMGFRPIICKPRDMDARIFQDEPMHLSSQLLDLELADRLSYDVSRNILFLNLEGYQIRLKEEVERVQRVIEYRCKDIGRKVALVVNYDGFYIDPLMIDNYAAMIGYMEKTYYSSSTRYSTSAFLRMKLGSALTKRSVAPHIFETRAEAAAALNNELIG